MSFRQLCRPDTQKKERGELGSVGRVGSKEQKASLEFFQVPWSAIHIDNTFCWLA